MFIAVTAAAFAIILAPPREMTPTDAQMDRSVEVVEPFDQVQRDCSGVQLPFRGAYVRGCYVRSVDRIYLPSDWPSKKEFEALRRHEHAHRVFGWTHP